MSASAAVPLSTGSDSSPRSSVVYATAAKIQATPRISGSRITTFALGVVAGRGRWCLSVGACLIPTALDTWAVKGHVTSLDDGPIDQNGEKVERSREIFRLGQKFLALSSSLLFAHRGAISIVRGGMETAGKTAHPQPRQRLGRPPGACPSTQSPPYRAVMDRSGTRLGFQSCTHVAERTMLSPRLFTRGR
jgi:hypothetical protein